MTHKELLQVNNKKKNIKKRMGKRLEQITKESIKMVNKTGKDAEHDLSSGNY